MVEGIQEKRLGEHGERGHSKEKVDGTFPETVCIYVLSELMHILLRANWVFEELIPSVLSYVVSTILCTYSFMWRVSWFPGT